MKIFPELCHPLSSDIESALKESNSVHAGPSANNKYDDLVEAFLRQNEELLTHHAVYPQLCTGVSQQIKELEGPSLQKLVGIDRLRVSAAIRFMQSNRARLMKGRSKYCSEE